LNSTSLSKPARAAIVRLTSNSVSEIGLAFTLTLMLIPGAFSRARSEDGAPGLSKDRSFTYWTSTLSEGALPLPDTASPACFSGSFAMFEVLPQALASAPWLHAPGRRAFLYGAVG